jgi:hypothetical protein
VSDTAHLAITEVQKQPVSCSTVFTNNLGVYLAGRMNIPSKHVIVIFCAYSKSFNKNKGETEKKILLIFYI